MLSRLQPLKLFKANDPWISRPQTEIEREVSWVFEPPQSQFCEHRQTPEQLFIAGLVPAMRTVAFDFFIVVIDDLVSIDTSQQQ
jgi:hypothetical protein